MSPRHPGFRAEDGPPRERIEAEAADWLVRREQGLRADEAALFAAWQARSPRHAETLAELEESWSALNRPRRQGRGPAWLARVDALEAQARRRRVRQRRQWQVGALAVAAALVVGFFALRPVVPDVTHPVVARTVILRPDQQALSDGSLVELNAGAEIEVDYSAARRRVRLRRGEALFSVTKDPARPFVVEVGGVEVRAVGTAFTVRYDADQVRVLVTEGRVAVERAADGQSLLPAAGPAPAAPVATGPGLPARTLEAGHRLELPAAQSPRPGRTVAAVSAAEVADALAWRHRRVEFNSTSLAEAVPLFNRQPGPRLVLADAETGALRISGVFWTDDPEGFARLLETSLGLAVARGATGEIVLRR